MRSFAAILYICGFVWYLFSFIYTMSTLPDVTLRNVLKFYGSVRCSVGLGNDSRN